MRHNSFRKTRKAGFTLIEVMVVIFLISLFSLLILPQMSFSGGQKTRLETVRLKSTLEWLRDSALYTGQEYRLAVACDGSTYQVEVKAESEFVVVSDQLVGARHLGKRQMALVPVQDVDCIPEQGLSYYFGTWGFQPLELHLNGPDERYLVVFSPTMLQPRLSLQ